MSVANRASYYENGCTRMVREDTMYLLFYLQFRDKNRSVMYSPLRMYRDNSHE